ncbi:MAG: aromatic ring-hydroxylating dioxygenase subunit alpha [Alphaproteobacteria bacterium]
MELPDAVKSIGEQIEEGGAIAPEDDFFEAYDVFSAEMGRIFTLPWLAVDHASRLAATGDFLRADIGSRSVILVRENAECVHAMRNACLHAGYRVCEEESGRTDRLFCQYHGWYYALDGKLTEPMLQPKMTDRSRFRLPRYAMQIRRGLILVDLSKVAPDPPPAGPIELGDVPEDLGERAVTRRTRHKAAHNWKRVRQMLWSSPGLAFGGDGVDTAVELGPLSLVALRDSDAALIRLIPKFPGQTEVEVVQMPRDGASAGEDGIGAALRDGDAMDAKPLDRGFYDWYWPLMKPQSTA